MSVGVDRTHEPSLSSWVPGAADHADFPIQNLPLGVFSPEGGPPRPGVAIGDAILDLRGVARLLPEAAGAAVASPTLNALIAMEPAAKTALRHRLSDLLAGEGLRSEVEALLHPADRCTMHLPCAIGDYTDFYAGIHHALNVGRQFRPDEPLLPNYRWVPIGYHGRASTVRPSGDPVLRPRGQRRAPGDDAPTFAPTGRLDFELELGAWIGRANDHGAPVPIGEAGAHVAGLCLLNDWSARDVQAWEYQPLGPFLSKSFHTTVSPWIVTMEALAPFRLPQPTRPPGDPTPLPHLLDEGDQRHGAFAIELETRLSTAAMRRAGMPPAQLGRGPATSMYWTVAQLVAHHASNGCRLRAGDLLGTGTISTPDDRGLGSMLEIARGGSRPIALPTGEIRSFLEDGDEISIAGRASADGFRTIGFGECRAEVRPAREVLGGHAFA